MIVRDILTLLNYDNSCNLHLETIISKYDKNNLQLSNVQDSKVMYLDLDYAWLHIYARYEKDATSEIVTIGNFYNLLKTGITLRNPVTHKDNQADFIPVKETDKLTLQTIKKYSDFIINRLYCGDNDLGIWFTR